MSKTTKWQGWISVHRGKRSANGELVPGEQIAVGPTFDFEVPGDSNNVSIAEEKLLDLWQQGGRLVDCNWTDADNVVTYPNLRSVSDDETD